MAIDERRADAELREKMRLERSLVEDRRRVQRELVRDAARQFESTGTAAVASRSRELMEPVLQDHYVRTQEVFDSRVRRDLPDDVAMTREESDELEAALAAVLATRAAFQAEEISQTDQDDANRGRQVAEAERGRAAEEGRAMGRREFAVIAAGVLERRMGGRVATIAMTETQAVAELSKGAEVRTLLGESPIPEPGPANDVPKAWVTQGDSRVRPAHRAADGQRVPSSQPFTVGGERLMYPGDTSLGASIGNVAGCRCSSVPDVDAVAANRRRR